MIDQHATAWEAVARPGRRLGHAIEVHASIGSTNDRVAELLATPDGEGVIVVAEQQTAGRGRRGRTWSSPAGRNLTASVGLHPGIAAGDAWQLGLAVALAVRTACAEVAPVSLKWPNDLVAEDGRKVGGLLVETTIEGDRVSSAVVGFGINVNWRAEEMPAELAGAATSLAELAGRDVGRQPLLGRVVEQLDEEIARLRAGHSPLDRYRAECTTFGHHVTVRTAGGSLQGLARDLDAAGALIVDTATGPMALASGEVVEVRRAAAT